MADASVNIGASRDESGKFWAFAQLPGDSRPLSDGPFNTDREAIARASELVDQFQHIAEMAWTNGYDEGRGRGRR